MPAHVHFRCPNGHALKALATAAGSSLRCPKPGCDAPVIVPQAVAPVKAIAPPPVADSSSDEVVDAVVTLPVLTQPPAAPVGTEAVTAPAVGPIPAPSATRTTLPGRRWLVIGGATIVPLVLIAAIIATRLIGGGSPADWGGRPRMPESLAQDTPDAHPIPSYSIWDDGNTVVVRVSADRYESIDIASIKDGHGSSGVTIGETEVSVRTHPDEGLKVLVDGQPVAEASAVVSSGQEEEAFHSMKGLGAWLLEPDSEGRFRYIDFHFLPVADREVQSLTAFSELRRLEIGGSDVTDSGLAALEKLPFLRRLSLQGALISDDALPVLAQVRDLVELDLDDTDVSNVGLKELLSLRHLRRLSLRGTLVTPDAVERFEKLRPGCDVSYETRPPMARLHFDGMYFSKTGMGMQTTVFGHPELNSFTPEYRCLQFLADGTYHWCDSMDPPQDFVKKVARGEKNLSENGTYVLRGRVILVSDAADTGKTKPSSRRPAFIFKGDKLYWGVDECLWIARVPAG
jgi:hypothetical protein